MDKSFSERLKQTDSFEKSEQKTFTALSQYVPIHKVEKKDERAITSPFSAKKGHSRTTFNMYDGEYLQKKYADDLNFENKSGSGFWNFIKFLFFNIPLINILYLKIKQSKIKATISAIDDMSMDIDTYSSYLKSHAFLYKTKFKSKNNQ